MTSPTTVAVVGFGDSILYGYDELGGLTPPNPYVDGYAARLAVQLGLSYISLAYPGATLMGGEGTPPFLAHSILDQMYSVPPFALGRLALLGLGTNDAIQHGTDPTAAATFLTNLQQGLLYLTSGRRDADPSQPRDALLDRIANIGTVPAGCTVFVGTAPPQTTVAGTATPAALTLYRTQVTTAVANVAAQGRRVFLVDLATAFNPATQANVDGIHPLRAGHDAIKALFYSRMQAVHI